MGFKALKPVLTRAAGKTWLAIKKASPTLLLIGAGVSAVAGTVIACKQTLKLNDILEEHKSTVEKIHKVYDDGNNEEYTKKDKDKDLTITYLKTGSKVAKLYSVPAALLVSSLGMASYSHTIMVKRNASLTAGLASASAALNKYRKRVKEELGEDADKKFLAGFDKKEVEMANEDGVIEKKVINAVEEYETQRAGLYSFFFDPSSREWVNDARLNRKFLDGRCSYFNELLKSRGYVFLNDILHELDIPLVAEGQMVGWWYDPDNPEPDGDNYIDFGFYDGHSPSARDFVNGYEPVVLLDFNCDGNILKHMKSGFPCDHVRK